MKRIGLLVTALCFVAAGSVVACDKDKKADSVKAPSAKVAGAASDKAGCPFAKKNAETVASGNKPCCNKGKAAAKTVAAKSDKPCCSKSKAAAKTVAAGIKKPGCSKGKSATVASAKSDKPCCSKGKSAAKTVAVDSRKPGCSKGKSATVASAKSDKPCCSKGKSAAKTVAAGIKKPGCSKGRSATVASAVTSKDGKPGCSKPCGGAGSATVASDAVRCPIARKQVETVLASMPSMKYKVGETTTGCYTSASTKAAESDGKMSYVVDGKSYDSRTEASTLVAKLIDEKMTQIRQVSYVAGGKEFHCSKSATAAAEGAKSPMIYRVAGFDFDCKKKAESVVAKADEASKAVTVAMVADGKPCKCAHSAKAAGKTVVYQIGDESTSNESVAKMLRSQRAARTFVETVAASL